MQFGVCASLEDARWIPKAGADYIETNVQTFLRPTEATWQPPPDVASLLPIPVCNCFLPNDLKVTGPDADLKRLETYAKRTFERARKMGTTIIVFGSGPSRRAPDGWPRQDAERQFIEAVRLLGPLADAEGITLALEPLRRAETNVLNTVAEGLNLLRRADAPSVAILCDLYQMTAENEPLSHLDDAKGFLAHCHIAEPASRGVPTPGKADYRPFFAQLKRIGYDRRISLECVWKDLKAQLVPTLDFLRREWKSA